MLKFEDYEDEDQEGMEFNEPKHENGKKKIVAILVLILIIIVGVFYDTFWGKGIIRNFAKNELSGIKLSGIMEKKKTEAKKEIMTFDADGKTAFRIYQNGFLHSTKDGVKFFNSMEKQEWNDTFTMVSPSLVSEGVFTGVADLNGRIARVYDNTGMKFSVQTDDPIIQVSLNNIGYLSLITKGTNDCKVSVYDQQGNVLVERIEADKGVFPISADISDDGKILAVSYIDASDVSLVSRILMFYINESEGKEFLNSMFAANEKQKQIVPVIQFMSDGSLAVAGDKSISLIGADGVEKWSTELNNELSALSFEKKDMIVVAYGDSFPGKEGKAKGNIQFLNLKGEEIASFDAGDDVTFLNAMDKGTVVGVGKDFYGFNNSGKAKWHHKAIQDVFDILFMNDGNKCLYVTKTSAEVINMSDENIPIKKSEEVKTEVRSTDEKTNKKDVNSVENEKAVTNGEKPETNKPGGE